MSLVSKLVNKMEEGGEYQFGLSFLNHWVEKVIFLILPLPVNKVIEVDKFPRECFLSFIFVIRFVSKKYRHKKFPIIKIGFIWIPVGKILSRKDVLCRTY